MYSYLLFFSYLLFHYSSNILIISYYNFLQYLSYWDDNIVTKELEESANNLLKGFDVSLDKVDEDIYHPTRVNIDDVFLDQHFIGEGN